MSKDNNPGQNPYKSHLLSRNALSNRGLNAMITSSLQNSSVNLGASISGLGASTSGLGASNSGLGLSISGLGASMKKIGKSIGKTISRRGSSNSRQLQTIRAGNSMRNSDAGNSNTTVNNASNSRRVSAVPQETSRQSRYFIVTK